MMYYIEYEKLTFTLLSLMTLQTESGVSTNKHSYLQEFYLFIYFNFCKKAC